MNGGFFSRIDYHVYLERLAKYREKYGYSVHAYCLLPNHVHLLLESSDQPLGKFMQGLQQSYSELPPPSIGSLTQIP